MSEGKCRFCGYESLPGHFVCETCCEKLVSPGQQMEDGEYRAYSYDTSNWWDSRACTVSTWDMDGDGKRVHQMIRLSGKGDDRHRNPNTPNYVWNPKREFLEMFRRKQMPYFTHIGKGTGMYVGHATSHLLRRENELSKQKSAMPMVSEDLAEYLRVNAPIQTALLKAAEEVLYYYDMCKHCTECREHCRVFILKAAVEKAKGGVE